MLSKEADKVLKKRDAVSSRMIPETIRIIKMKANVHTEDKEKKENIM